MYRTGTDSAMVKKIYDLNDADDELCRMAGLMLSEDWVEGFPANGWKSREEEYQERECERCEVEAAIEKTRTDAEKHWSEK